MFVYPLALLSKTAEQIRILFGVDTFEDLRHIVLDGDPDPFMASFAESLWPLVIMLMLLLCSDHRELY